jgi:hypothetical protein
MFARNLTSLQLGLSAGRGRPDDVDVPTGVACGRSRDTPGGYHAHLEAQVPPDILRCGGVGAALPTGIAWFGGWCLDTRAGRFRGPA